MSLNFGARILAVAVIGLLSVSPSWARVGVASTVDGEPKGLPPGATERVINIGNDMQPNERVTTGENDKAHIVFLDGSSLTVGPNSVLTIDKFVYDPDRKTGELALNASRGVFRFVGGAISKNSEVSVKTPSATIGIRGGIAVSAIAANGSTTAYLLFGASLTVTSHGVTQITTQPGFQIVTPMGGPPSAPTPIPPGGLSFVGVFQSSGGGPGLAAIGAAFANAGFSRFNSGLSPAVLLAAIYATQQAQLKTGGGTQLAANNPLQKTDPLQSGNPLQSSNPLLGTNPLQGSNPLQGAGPIQAVGPMPDYGLGGPTPPPNVVGQAPPPDFAAGGCFSNERLANILGTLPTPEVLELLVNILKNPCAEPTALGLIAGFPVTSTLGSTSPLSSTAPTAPGPLTQNVTPRPLVFNPSDPSTTPLSPPPGQLPPTFSGSPTIYSSPTVFNPPCQAQVSQSNC